MLDTGLSRTGLDRDWARTVGIEPVPASSTAVVDTIRLGELTLRNHPVALYPLHGLSEASGRLQVGLVGHDVLQHYTVDIDYQQRRVRLFDPARYRYKGTGVTVRFTADADLPLLRAQVKVRGRHAIPARLLLDTGASGLCLILTTPFAEQHGLGRVAPGMAGGGGRPGREGRGGAGGDVSDARKALRVDGVVRRLVLRRDGDTIRVALKRRRLL